MSYIIPQTTRTQWKKQAQEAGMAYSTVVGQHVYDLQGLIDVLDQQLTQSTQALEGTTANTPEFEAAKRKVKDLSTKLDHTRQQLAAYQLEQQRAGAS